MKYIISFLILFLINEFSFSQEISIDSLKSLKEALILKRLEIQDSLNLIDQRITVLNSNIEASGEYSEVWIKENSKIKNSPHVLGNVIGEIKERSLVKVYEYENGYFLIQLDSLTGYANEIYLTSSYKLARMKDDYNYHVFEKEFGEEVARKLADHKIWLGMTSRMAVISIGEPIEKNKTTGSFGVHEQWVYKSKYLYFEDGVLKTIQN